jgi:hypothetical protein
MLKEIPSQTLTDWHAFFEIRNEKPGSQPQHEPQNHDVFGVLKRAFPQLVRKKK